jgi:hypothetical protein
VFVCCVDKTRWQSIFVVVVTFDATIGLRHREPWIRGNIKACSARVRQIFSSLFDDSLNTDAQQPGDAFATLI